MRHFKADLKKDIEREMNDLMEYDDWKSQSNKEIF